MESWGHTRHDYDVCACAHKHAHMLRCMHTIFLACLGLYLSRIGSDQSDLGIYEIRETYPS